MKSYQCSISSSTSASTVEGSATPAAASADGKDRVVWGADDFGRGPVVTIKPLDAFSQFVLHKIVLYVVPSSAGPEDA